MHEGCAEPPLAEGRMESSGNGNGAPLAEGRMESEEGASYKGILIALAPPHIIHQNCDEPEFAPLAEGRMTGAFINKVFLRAASRF